jgi:hypothetical protein
MDGATILGNPKKLDVAPSVEEFAVATGPSATMPISACSPG